MMNLSKLNHALRDKPVTLRYETVVVASVACNGAAAILSLMPFLSNLFEKDQPVGGRLDDLRQQMMEAGKELWKALEVARDGVKEESETPQP